MKKNIIISAVLSLITFIAIPLAVVFLIGGMDALGIILLLFFTLNPIVSIVIGILSADEKVHWCLPVINAAIFLIAESVLIGFEISILIAAIIYAGFGLAAAYITAVIKNKKASTAE